MPILIPFLAALSVAGATPVPHPADTLRLEVGSPEVDGRVYPVHQARNRVYIGDATSPVTTWTNHLTLGDSAGMPVMRWATRGVQPNGSTWELLQTYHGVTMKLLTYSLTSSSGAYTRLRVDGLRVRGVQRPPGDSGVEKVVDRVLPRMGFMASASDLVPPAVGLEAGAVMIAPVWGPSMEEPVDREFTVVGEERVEVEGEDVVAWKVVEREAATGKLVATWWMTESSPYMVLAEIPLANGGVQRITGVALDG